MDFKIFYKHKNTDTHPKSEDSHQNSIDPTFVKKSIPDSTSHHNPKPIKNRCFPVASTGFANLFFTEKPQDQEQLIHQFEVIFTRILPKIRIPYFTDDNQLEFHGFFAKIEAIIQKYDPDAKVYLGGGSIRSIIAFIYKELLDANLEGLDPLEALQDFGSGKRKFSVENDKGELSPIHVLGVQSDIDIYIEFSENCKNKNEAIIDAKTFINSGLKKIPDHPLKNLVFPPADVKSYEEQMQRAHRNGGSALDWVVFPLTEKTGTHFKTPQQCPDVLKSICKGKLPYYPVDNAEIPTITTLRTYRSLFELPFLELEESDLKRFVEDLKQVLPTLKDEELRNRTNIVFQKILRNTRFPSRVNFELQTKDEINVSRGKLLQEISHSFSSNKNLPALPELLPPKISNLNLDIELLNKFSKANLFMPISDFIQKHTNNGVLYHGTPDLRNIPPIIRGNLIVSNQTQGTAACGRGFYTTKDYATAKSYARNGDVLSFIIKEKNLKIVDIKTIPHNLMIELRLKAKEKEIDINEYLATYLGVDVVINEHIILQNNQVSSLNKQQERFLLDMFLPDFMNAIEYFQHLYKRSIIDYFFNRFKNDKNLNIDPFEFNHHFLALDNFQIILGLMEADETRCFQNTYDPVIQQAINTAFVLVDQTKALSRGGFYKNSYILMNDKKFVIKVIKNAGLSLEYASTQLKDDEEVVLEAVKRDGYALEYASDRLKDHKEVVLKALKKDTYAMKFASDRLKDDEIFVLEVMRNNESALKFASDRLKNDKKFILEAIKNKFNPLPYISDRLNGDRDIVLNAIKNDRSALLFASECLKDNKNFILEVIQEKPMALEFASERLKDDTIIVLEAVKRYRYALKYASDRFKDNKNLILKVIQENPMAIEFASDRLKDDEDFILKATKIDKRAIYFASERLQKALKNKMNQP